MRLALSAGRSASKRVSEKSATVITEFNLNSEKRSQESRQAREALKKSVESKLVEEKLQQMQKEKQKRKVERC